MFLVGRYSVSTELPSFLTKNEMPDRRVAVYAAVPTLYMELVAKGLKLAFDFFQKASVGLFSLCYP